MTKFTAVGKALRNLTFGTVAALTLAAATGGAETAQAMPLAPVAGTTSQALPGVEHVYYYRYYRPYYRVYRPYYGYRRPVPCRGSGYIAKHYC